MKRHLSIVRNTEAGPERAKALPLRESSCHLDQHDASLLGERQLEATSDPVTDRLCSKPRHEWRMSGSGILRRLVKYAQLSITDLATMLDLQRPQMSRQLAGRDPFPVENFVGIAERNPWLGGEVIVAYAEGCGLSADILEVTGQRLIELATQKRKEK